MARPSTNCLQSILKSMSVVLVLLCSFFFLHQWILPLVAFIIPDLDPALFDLAIYGAYPTQEYITFGLQSPRARQLKWDNECGQGLVFLTPNGPALDTPGPMIVDAMGGLVWMSEEFGVTANLKVQNWKGDNYLTLWSGEKAATSGKGVYFMVPMCIMVCILESADDFYQIDSTYQVVKMISAVGEGLFGDLHEFVITEAGTGLLTVYNTTHGDLTGMGLGHGPNGWIVDSIFQEVDLETGELLFQWRASDHFSPNETFMTNPFGGHLETAPFDWYHINSVDKDSKGNYLISSRHFHSVTCISPLGEILWILGGRDNEFTDLSEGQATNFKWQHDARWVSEEDGILTVFDNSKAGPLHVDAPHSRAMFVQLDIVNRTAKLAQSLVSHQNILSSSQGSVQVLQESGHTFVGWGSAAAYSEYSEEGSLICETHLAASWSFWFERFKSYRTMKSLNWHAYPRNPLKVKIVEGRLYVSWNGATEVAYWSLDMCFDEHFREVIDLQSVGDSAEFEYDEDQYLSEFDNIDIIPKVGFEGSFDLPSISAEERSHIRYRVAALDEKHAVLRYSDVILHDDAAETRSNSWWTAPVRLFLIVGFLIGARVIYKCYHNKRRIYIHLHESVLSPPVWMEWKAPSPWRRSGRLSMYEWMRVKWSRGGGLSPPG